MRAGMRAAGRWLVAVRACVCVSVGAAEEGGPDDSDAASPNIPGGGREEPPKPCPPLPAPPAGCAAMCAVSSCRVARSDVKELVCSKQSKSWWVASS